MWRWTVLRYETRGTVPDMETGLPKSLRWAESLESMVPWFSMAADFMWNLVVSSSRGRRMAKNGARSLLCWVSFVFLFLCSTARSDWDAGYFIKILWCRIFLTFQDFLLSCQEHSVCKKGACKCTKESALSNSRLKFVAPFQDKEGLIRLRDSAARHWLCR